MRTMDLKGELIETKRRERVPIKPELEKDTSKEKVHSIRYQSEDHVD
jgi:hypothetical protein